MMVGWENEGKDAHPPSPAEKQLLIFLAQNVKRASNLYLIYMGSEWQILIVSGWMLNTA